MNAIKNIIALSLVMAATICLLSGCSTAQQPSGATLPPQPDKKILIVYLSRTNNTKAIAEFIHQKIGGTLVALEVKTLIRLTITLLCSRWPGRMKRGICRL